MQTHGRDLIHLAHDFDLSFSQMKALHALIAEPEAISVKTLGEKLGLSLAAMSRAADELVQRGLVNRTEDPTDRRVKRLCLTDEGRDLVQRMRELRMALEAGVGTVVIVENLQTFQAWPVPCEGVVIWGAGYLAPRLSRLPWAQEARRLGHSSRW